MKYEISDESSDDCDFRKFKEKMIKSILDRCGLSESDLQLAKIDRNSLAWSDLQRFIDREKLAHIIVENRDDFEGICLKMKPQLELKGKEPTR